MGSNPTIFKTPDPLPTPPRAQVRSVFGAYGIGVDPRHLSLIADFMTHLVSHVFMSHDKFITNHYIWSNSHFIAVLHSRRQLSLPA